MVLDIILMLVPTYAIVYEPKGDILLLKYGGGLSNTMVVGPGSFGALLDDGNSFIHRSMVSTRETIVIRGSLVKDVSWHVALTRSLTVRTDLSMMGTCSPFAHICKVAGKNSSS